MNKMWGLADICHSETSCLQMGNNHQVWGGILPQTQGQVFISVATSVLPASGTPCSVSVTEVIEWAAQTVPWKQAALVPDRSRRGPGVLAPLPSAILPQDLLLSRLGNRVTHTLRCCTVTHGTCCCRHPDVCWYLGNMQGPVSPIITPWDCFLGPSQALVVATTLAQKSW